MSTIRRQCLNCCLVLTPFIRRYKLADSPDNILAILRTWITPTPFSNEDIVCDGCYTLLQSASESQEPVTPAFGHTSVCYGCGISILRSRTHTVPLTSPQRNLILTWVPPHQANRLARVCRACWMAATRSIERQQLQDAQRSINSAVPVELPQEQIEAESNIPVPPPLPEIRAVPQPVRQTIPKVLSNVYKRMAATPNHCIFGDCQNVELLLVPSVLKELLLRFYKIYVPLSARICHYHANSHLWDELLPTYHDFTGFQMDDMMTILERAVERKLEFFLI